MAPAKPILIGAGDSPAKNNDLTCFKTFPIEAATCLHVGPCLWSGQWIRLQDLIIPDLRSFLKFPTTINNEALFQFPHVPVGDRMLFKHLSMYYSVLEAGMDVALSLLEAPGVSLDRFFSKQKNREFKLKYLRKLFDNNNNVVCLQEVHGKDEYLQAIQVLAPRFRLYGTFFLENAGGSAICIHWDLLPEEAIVTHFIPCQGRDHIVHIQTGRQNLVIVNVHF